MLLTLGKQRKMRTTRNTKNSQSKSEQWVQVFESHIRQLQMRSTTILSREDDGTNNGCWMEVEPCALNFSPISMITRGPPGSAKQMHLIRMIYAIDSLPILIPREKQQKIWSGLANKYTCFSASQRHFYKSKRTWTHCRLGGLFNRIGWLCFLVASNWRSCSLGWCDMNFEHFCFCFPQDFFRNYTTCSEFPVGRK